MTFRYAKDEIILLGFAVLLTFLGLAVYSVIVLKTPFQAGDFAMGGAGILTAIGGGQGVRDWLIGKGDSYAKSDDH